MLKIALSEYIKVGESKDNRRLMGRDIHFHIDRERGRGAFRYTMKDGLFTYLQSTFFQLVTDKPYLGLREEDNRIMT